MLIVTLMAYYFISFISFICAGSNAFLNTAENGITEVYPKVVLTKEKVFSKKTNYKSKAISWYRLRRFY